MAYSSLTIVSNANLLQFAVFLPEWYISEFWQFRLKIDTINGETEILLVSKGHLSYLKNYYKC